MVAQPTVTAIAERSAPVAQHSVTRTHTSRRIEHLPPLFGGTKAIS